MALGLGSYRTGARAQPAESIAATTTEQLQKFVTERLLPFKYPWRVEYRASLPKSGTGKIERQARQARNART